MEQENKPANTLWTRDFTIITVGSVISMLGNALSGFAMSLLVLDYTGSTFLFALYNVIYMLPNVAAPVLSGPFLDRFSRRKTIYTLDFITAGIYVLFALILWSGRFSFVTLAVGCFLLGTINSVYFVAYDSFYPLLITEGNYSKAYSIASTLETLTMVMVPVSAYLYNRIGIVPLFLLDAVSYLIAAIMETQITAGEAYVEKQKESFQQNAENRGSMARQLTADFKEGMRYLVSEKGLLAVTLYFTFSSLFGGATSSVTLPYFRSTFENGEYIYMLVWGMSGVGRAIGGAIHYRRKLPVQKKYAIAMAVYVTISLLEGVYLYFPIGVMMVMCFTTGIGGVTSYNIRISATQKHVPDEKKGRFNGTFNTLNTVGALVGELAAGALAEFLPIRGVVSGFALITIIAAVVFIGGRRRDVAALYNVEN